MKYIFIMLFLFLVSCKVQRGEPFGLVDTSNVEQENYLSVNMSDTIVIDKINDEIYSSDIIDSVSFIPLETTTESLFAYCTGLAFYKNKIYLLDRFAAESVLIFDMNGKFLKRIGNKGGAPDEFELLSGMAVDKNHDRLVLYDNRKRKMVYFTLDGEYIKNEKVHFRFDGEYAILPSERMVAATGKKDYNIHLGNLEDYRLLYTDSLGQIVKAAYCFDDNKELPIYYEKMLDTESGILYNIPFVNKLYSITDTTLSVRYVVEYKNYPCISQDKLLQLKTLDELSEYQRNTIGISSSTLAESRTHLIFNSDNMDNFYTIYDKESQKSISFRRLLFNNDFVFGLCPMYSYGDYLVALASPEQLIVMRDYLEKNKIKVSDHLLNVYTNVQEEDNPVLVLLKLKNI